MSRQLCVAVRSEDDGGPVMLPTLVRTLEALQTVLLQIGDMLAAMEARPAEARPSEGRFSKAIHAACELRIADLRFGSAETLLELPPPEPTLFPDAPDLGLQALDVTRALTAELTSGADWQRVHQLLPADAYRDLVLRSYRGLCPTRADRAYVAVSDPATPDQVYRLDAAIRTNVQLLAAQASPEDVLQERQFIGRINVLQADPRTSTLVLPDGRSFRFPYDELLTEDLHRLWDELVIVRAICRVVPHETEDDYIAEIKDVSDILPVDAALLEMAAIPSPAGDLPLRTPLSVAPDFADNLVTFQYEPLGIVACGDTREEAAQAFREELAWLWQFYAEPSERPLAPSALRLRQRLRDMVGEDGA